MTPCRRPGRRAAGLALSGVLVAGTAAGFSRRPPEPPATAAAETSPAAEPDAGPTSRFEGVELVGQDADGTVWQLRADQGWGREGEASGTLQGVRATLRRGEHDLVLEAPRAVAEGGRAFRFADGVRITWGGYQVQVEDAVYRRDRGRVTSESPVRFTGPGLRVTGVGVEVEVARRVVHIPAEARAVLGEEEP